MATLFIKAAVSQEPPQSTGGLARLVLTLVRPYKKWVFIILLAMLLETVMSLAAPWPLKIIIDNVIEKDPLPYWLSWVHNSFLSDDSITLAAVAAISLVIFAALGALAGYINSYFTESVAQYVANDMRQKMYHHLQKLSLAYYDSHQVAKIISTMTTDVTTIQEFASQALLRILIDALTIAGMVSIMVYLHLDFALVAIGITPFLLLFVARFKREVKKATREVRKDQANMAAVLQQGLESIRVVNAFGQQNLEEEKLRTASMETVKAALKARRLKAMLVPVINTTVAICVALVLWRGATLVLSGVMTIGALTVFLTYLNKFFHPVQDMAKMSNNIAQATVALERIRMILDADNVIPEKPDAIIPTQLKGDIKFENVSFGYNKDEIVLHDLNIDIKAGQRIGICGPSGGGKSTIASLIARFYDPLTGRVLIDGKDVKDYNLEGLRRQIGFVLQDTFLFYGTIRDNIAYGKPGASDEEIIAAAKLSNADRFISKMPDGYSTMVGERGLTLSGGQRQCIGIARVIVRNAPILIMDEPTAALDAESEITVIEALEKLMAGRSVIIIAHRLSTIRDADKIIVLKGGKIDEAGTHDELMANEKTYYELFHAQSREPVIASINQVTETIERG